MANRLYGHEISPMQHCHLRADGNAADTRSSRVPMSPTPAQAGQCGPIFLAG
jgi:hypothetical protein